jgi:hypothetical protein
MTALSCLSVSSGGSGKRDALFFPEMLKTRAVYEVTSTVYSIGKQHVSLKHKSETHIVCSRQYK